MNGKNKSLDFLSNLTGSRAALIVLFAAGGYFLWTEHQALVLAVMPYAIFLLCPLMHFFMHGRHGNHGKGPKSDDHADHSHS